MTPSESRSPPVLAPGWVAVPWLLLGIVIAEPLWGFSRVWYGVELRLRQPLPYQHRNTLRDFKAFLEDLIFLWISTSNGAATLRPTR